MITGKDLIELGYKPGKWFKIFLADANKAMLDGISKEDALKEAQFYFVEEPVKTPMRESPVKYSVFLDPVTDVERTNLEKVKADMDKLMVYPSVIKAAIMPDACPAGDIPVGGVIATENTLHPQWHSADICCSMMMTEYDIKTGTKDILDTATRVSHFGGGGRDDGGIEHNYGELIETLIDRAINNTFFDNISLDLFHSQFMTQGDGNHFFFVGKRRSTGNISIVTHHGSRGLGAQLYKEAVRCLKKQLDPWFIADSEIGEEYQDALSIVYAWTRLNHSAIHDAIRDNLGLSPLDNIWNPHNYIQKRDDGLFYHAKGATPSFNPEDRALIPLSMNQPVIITKAGSNEDALGFAPHGAGRNMSRTDHKNTKKDQHVKNIVKDETGNLDIRFYSGVPDISELPSAYKEPKAIIKAIEKHKLATIVDYIDPLGSLMAGDPAQEYTFKTIRPNINTTNSATSEWGAAVMSPQPIIRENLIEVLGWEENLLDDDF